MTTDLTRRTILKNAMSMLACSALGATVSSLGCRDKNIAPPNKVAPSKDAAPCPAATNFNVVLHGLFLIELWDDKDGAGHPIPPDQRIRIVAPDCSVLNIPHAYHAGSWSTKKFRGFARAKDYFSQWSLPQATKPSASLPTMAHFAGTLDYSKEYFSLYLPYPKAITPLRVIDKTKIRHSGSITDADFPLVVALTYDVGQTPPQPLMAVPNGSWDPNSNFHIFAEPECEVDCVDITTHGNDTLMQTKKLFRNPADYDVQMTDMIDCSQPLPGSALDQCPSALGALNVTTDEEQAYFEIFPCPPVRAKKRLIPPLHMATCASVVLTGP